MLRLVLRPLLVILTLGALLIALFQVAGRITVTLLDELEPGVNRVLDSRGITIHGLSGEWRMLNPVLHAERVEFPAGRVIGVVLEIDMVESVLRGTLLARRLKVDDAEVVLEKPRGEPWRLRGAIVGKQFDVMPLLEHSNQLELVGRLIFDREGMAPATITVSYVGLNRGGEHRHALALRNDDDDCVEACLLEVDLHSRERLWPVHPGRARISARTRGFLLPRPVLGISPVQVAELDLGWQRAGAESGGHVRVRTEQLDMPGDVTLAMRLEGAVRGRDDVHSGSVTDWQVEQGEDVWALPEMAVNADGESVSVWMPSLDLARAAGFLRLALADVAPAERWLGGLNPQGTARNVRLAYAFDAGALAYAASMSGLALDGFKGVPAVRNAGGELFGFEQGVQLNLNAQSMALAFPDVFIGEWQLPYAQGMLQGWFGRNYFGVRGLNLRAETSGTRAAGGFAMTRPPDREGQRLLLLVSTDHIAVQEAQRFVPYRLPQGLQDWLHTAPLGGSLEHARLAYQGQFQEEPGELARRIELAARVHQGRLRYHPEWPEVEAVSGRLAVAGPLVEMDVDRAESAGASVGGSRVRVVDNAAAVDVSLDAETEGGAVLDFLRDTPLSTWLEFIEPDWQAAGPMRLSGELRVPLGAAQQSTGVAVRLRGDLRGVNVELPGYRVALEELDGSFRYRYPHHFDATNVTGRLFGEPVILGANSAGGRVHLLFAGRARPPDVWQMIDMRDRGLARGAFDFEADLAIGVAEGQQTELMVSSTLEGTAIDLPAGFGKHAEERERGEVYLRFLPDYRVVRFGYQDASGWLHFDQAPLRGAIGFGGTVAMEGEPADADGHLVLSGRLDGFELDEVIPDGDGAGDSGGLLSLPIRLEALDVGEIKVGGFPVTGATLNGSVSRDGLAIDVDSRQVTGSIIRRGEAPLEVDFARVQVPAAEDEEARGVDPLEPSLIAELPAADVVVHQLTLGADDYGSWRFQMRPAGDDLEVRALDAVVRGVRIASDAGLVWLGGANETRFDGTLTAANLAEVLPQWGYAPNVETASASLEGTFAWNGSPLMVDLLALRGDARARAEQGRFLEVESGAGAQKIFSLLNFTAIAKRVSLNFSDIFGRGVSFDELRADFTLDEGLLEFREPMQVEGTGSKFRVTGRVDLAERRLDNDMIVTLPVSKSLPWYAAYVALANPLAGLGVLVGERMLRKPLEQFSSARYHIGGTLDDPDVKFVSVFDAAPANGGVAPGNGGGSAEAPGPDAWNEFEELRTDDE